MGEHNKPKEVKREVTLEDFRPANNELKALMALAKEQELERKKTIYFNAILDRVYNLKKDE